MSYGEIKMKLENDMIDYDEILKEYDKRSFLKLGVHGDYVTDYESIYDFEMKFKDYEDLMSESLM